MEPNKDIDDLFKMPEGDEFSSKKNEDLIPTPQQPKKQSNEPSEETKLKEESELMNKKRSSRSFGCFHLLVIVWIFILLFVIFLLLSGVADSLVFRQIGLETKQIAEFTKLITNISFVLILLSVFISTLYYFARFIFLSNQQLKRTAIIKGLVSLILLLFYLVGWFYILSVLDPLISGEYENKGRISVYPVGSDNAIDPVGLITPVTLEYKFEGLSPDRAANYRVLGLLWDLDGRGYGGGKSGSSVTTTYELKPDNPNFDVKVRVDLEQIASGVRIQEEYIIPVSIAHARPIIEVSTSRLIGLVPLEVTFDASRTYDSDGEISKIEWDVDSDGEYDEEGTNITKVWDNPGSYKVDIKVTDNDGYESFESFNIEATEREMIYIPKYEFERDQFSLEYIFDASSSDLLGKQVDNYNWKMSGLNFERNLTGKRISVTFPRPGTYELQLTLSGPDGQESLFEQFDVVDMGSKPEAVIELSATEGELEKKSRVYSGSIPLTLSLSAENSKDEDSNIISYEWDMDGDGDIDVEGSTGEFSYYEPGTYTVSLTVKDSAGFFDTVEETLVLEKEPFVVSLIAEPTNGNAPLIVEFDASGTSYDFADIEKFRWDFGNGTPAKLADAQISQRFEKSGQYTVSVTAIAENGEEKSKSVQIVVGDAPLFVRFIPTQTKGAAPLAVSFFPEVVGENPNRVTYEWDFGDGSRSDEKEPNYIFETPGTYPVTLRITNLEGTVTDFTREIVVE